MLSIAALLVLAFALVPIQSCAYPNPEPESGDWLVTKNPSGASRPVSSIYVPQSDGTWYAELRNSGLRSMVLEIYDQSGGGTKIFHQNIIFSKFNAYPSGIVKSDTCNMTGASAYKIVSKGFGGHLGSTATITSVFSPRLPSGLVLDETFTSWQTLDSGWSIWNMSLGGYRSWFDVSGGLFLASSNDMLVHGDYASYANWTGLVKYDDSVFISFDIYLPLNCDQKYGWAGQVFWFVIYDPAGVPAIVTRFVMDSPWDTSHVGWVYWAGPDAVEICGFDAGWHHVDYMLQKGSETWTAAFDGVAYSGLWFSESSTVAPDIGMIQFQNLLMEDIQVVLVDNLRIEVC